MTELEKKIYQSALDVLPEIIESVKKTKTDKKYIICMFLCDFVTDKIYYDTKLKKFTKIEYSKGKGDATLIDSGTSGYFDDYEVCEFEIDIPVN